MLNYFIVKAIMRQYSQQFYDTWGNSSTQVICFMFLSFTNVETPSDSWTNTQKENKKTEIILKKNYVEVDVHA